MVRVSAWFSICKYCIRVERRLIAPNSAQRPTRGPFAGRRGPEVVPNPKAVLPRGLATLRSCDLVSDFPNQFAITFVALN